MRNKETLSCFDATVVADVGLPPRVHWPAPALTRGQATAFTSAARRRGSADAGAPRRAPLAARSGVGGSPVARLVELARTGARPRTAPGSLMLVLPARPSTEDEAWAAPAPPPPPPPPPSGAKAPRANPPNSAFRRAYELGSLPCAIDTAAAKRALRWRDGGPTDFSVLPLFADGLREHEFPFDFVAREGTRELIARAGARLPALVPALVQPLVRALNTREPPVVRAAVDTLQRIVAADDAVARALTPHLPLLLPVLAIFALESRARAGCGPRGTPGCLGDHIGVLLDMVQARGGPGAARAIKRALPVWECLATAA